MLSSNAIMTLMTDSMMESPEPMTDRKPPQATDGRGYDGYDAYKPTLHTNAPVIGGFPAAFAFVVNPARFSGVVESVHIMPPPR